MTSISVEKSYLPQYIQYSGGKGGGNGSLPAVEYEGTYGSAPPAGDLPPSDIICHAQPSDIYGDTKGGYQSLNGSVPNQTIYPPLISHQKNGIDHTNFNHQNVNQKTPLLAKKKKIVPTKTNFFGILLAFISGVFFTLCSGTVKYLTDVDPMELLIFRSLFQVAVTLPIALCKGQHLMGPEGSRVLLFFQGIIGGTTLVMLFYSFRLLPLGDAATIIFSSPVFVMVMSHIWLREPCGFYRTLIVFLLVTGVVFITKPPFLFARAGEETYNLLGYAAAVAGTVFTALNIVIMRKCKDCHFSVVVFQFSFWSLVISTAILLVTGKPELPVLPTSQWVLVLFVGIFGLSGQILVAIALTYEGAGRVAVTRSMDIVLAYVLQVLIFNEVPDWKSVMGASMVMFCVVGMGVEDLVHKWVNNLP